MDNRIWQLKQPELNHKSACTKIPYKGFEISIAMDDNCGVMQKVLGRSDIRVYLNEEDVTSWFWSDYKRDPLVIANAENLKLIFSGIDLQVEAGNLPNSNKTEDTETERESKKILLLRRLGDILNGISNIYSQEYRYTCVAMNDELSPACLGILMQLSESGPMEMDADASFQMHNLLVLVELKLIAFVAMRSQRGYVAITHRGLDVLQAVDRSTSMDS